MYELMVLVVSPFENINVWINGVSSESFENINVWINGVSSESLWKD